MASRNSDNGNPVVAFIDLGTYSVRLLIVRVNSNKSFTILTDQKESVRLGGDEFASNLLQDEAMERAATAMAGFAEMARSFGASEIVTTATSATREAANQREFLELLRRRTGLDVRVISGREEARLVYLGVSRNAKLDGATAAFLDVGGGSTELAIGDAREWSYLDSLKLGAIRISQMFGLDRRVSPVKPAQYAEVCEYIQSAAIRTIQHVRGLRFSRLIASSGTARNLATIAARLRGAEPGPNPSISREQLRNVAAWLCSTPLAQRRQIPGLNPERADIIVGGAAIIESLMDALGVAAYETTKCGLRDGLLVNYLQRTEHADLINDLDPRARSVWLLGRRCGFDEPHARTVARLTVELFDSARALGLHHHGPEERELLEYAAVLHDIGVFLSFVNHQAHSYYLIRHADLVGFDQRELAIIAALARFHRKGAPRKKQPELLELDAVSVRFIRQTYLYLRIAESLDRSHSGVIDDAQFVRGNGGLALRVAARGDCDLEAWAVQRHLKPLQKTLGEPVRAEFNAKAPPSDVKFESNLDVSR